MCKFTDSPAPSTPLVLQEIKFMKTSGLKMLSLPLRGNKETTRISAASTYRTASAHQMIQILLNSSTISYNISLCVQPSQHPLVPHVGF